jgi:hypothetical protein
MNRFFQFCAAAAMACAASEASAEDAAYRIDIVGTVPVICGVQSSEISADMANPSNVDLGQLSEFCNDPNGYEVWADYAPGVGSASINVDGKLVPLSSTGSTLIGSSRTAARQTRRLGLDLGEDRQRLTTISMRIVPL